MKAKDTLLLNKTIIQNPILVRRAWFHFWHVASHILINVLLHSRSAIGPTMSTMLLNCVSINGIDPNGTIVTLPFLTVFWHTSQEWQNLVMSWHSPGQMKFWSILTSVFLAPR